MVAGINRKGQQAQAWADLVVNFLPPPLFCLHSSRPVWTSAKNVIQNDAPRQRQVKNLQRKDCHSDLSEWKGAEREREREKPISTGSKLCGCSPMEVVEWIWNTRGREHFCLQRDSLKRGQTFSNVFFFLFLSSYR